MFNMPIISISMPKKVLEEIEDFGKEYGFASKSEVIRYAVRQLINEEKKPIDGEYINAILIVVHKEESEMLISKIKHKIKRLIKTQMHMHIKENKCMEVFIAEGKTKDIKFLNKSFKSIKGILYCKLIILN